MFTRTCIPQFPKDRPMSISVMTFVLLATDCKVEALQVERFNILLIILDHVILVGPLANLWDVT